MSRLFDGVDDVMTYGSVSGIDTTGASTLLVVVRIMTTTDTTWLSFIECETSGTDTEACGLGRRDTSGNIYVNHNGTERNAIQITDSDGWMVVAATKAAGNSIPRLHKCVFGGSNTHTDGASQLISGASITGGEIKLGGDDDFANIRLAAAAIFDKVLSDGEIEGIKTAATTASINALGPVWLVDDSDAFATDLVGSVDRTAIVGTADDADDPASWVYGLGGTDYTGNVTGAGAATASGSTPMVSTLTRPYVLTTIA